VKLFTISSFYQSFMDDALDTTRAISMYLVLVSPKVAKATRRIARSAAAQ
jgi:hypothetical protein